MTPIDWTKLHHAYGSAGDIPALLSRARTARAPTTHTDEPWFTLWSALYHQDDIYSASYAAVPELVAIASERGGAIAAECLFLAASIELRRQEPDAPAMSPELRAAYDQALARARPLASDLARRAPDDEGKLEVAATVFDGDYDGARALLELDGDEEA